MEIRKNSLLKAFFSSSPKSLTAVFNVTFSESLGHNIASLGEKTCWCSGNDLPVIGMNLVIPWKDTASGMVYRGHSNSFPENQQVEIEGYPHPPVTLRGTQNNTHLQWSLLVGIISPKDEVPFATERSKVLRAEQQIPVLRPATSQFIAKVPKERASSWAIWVEPVVRNDS